MANVVALIKSLEDRLTKAEKKIADYIVKYPEKVLGMTAKELGISSRTSAATVIRLSKKLGIDSFPQMKLMLYKEQSREIKVGYFDITEGESFIEIKEKLLGNAYQSLSDTLSLLEEQQIEQAINAIEQAETVYIYGVGSSYLVAENIAQKWNRIGKPCIVLRDTHNLIAAIVGNPKNNLFIGVSNSGETLEVLRIMKIVKKENVKTISITQFGSNSISNVAEINLKHIRVNEPAYRGAATVSLHVQFFLVDVLFYAYSTKHYEDVMEKIVHSREEIISYNEK